MRFSSKTVFQAFLAITFCSGLLIAFGHFGFAGGMMNLNFFVLLLAVFLYIKEIK